jgi:hypothetical protein
VGVGGGVGWVGVRHQLPATSSATPVVQTNAVSTSTAKSTSQRITAVGGGLAGAAMGEGIGSVDGHGWRIGELHSGNSRGKGVGTSTRDQTLTKANGQECPSGW